MQIDWPGVAVAIVAGMAVAFVWYQKGPIADAWERLTGVTGREVLGWATLTVRMYADCQAKVDGLREAWPK